MTCLTVAAETFDQCFPDYGFTLQHRLADLPEFELPQLLDLSRKLPADCLEYNAGTVVPGQDPDQTPRNGLSVQETIERIEQCKSWLVLKHVERDPQYRALLDACLDEIYPHAGRKLTGLHDRAAFIFITSPGSVTPFHFDREHNFLLQVRGEKTMHQFDKFDRDILPETAIEDKYVDGSAHRNQPFRDEFQRKAQTFTLNPGDGLFVPINSPHWVQNGNEVSVSFSITFHSDQSDQMARLYKLNGMLRRRLGINPTPVGHSARMDAFKHSGIMAAQRVRSLLP
ncbi:MAG: cupin-like domain-containing protein [Gammaproteobacteria bacterium]|nr:cupin-like domain-containing protein [Gammaproteobacteria bacterium]MBU1725809.1 cupin-like domain-containing protein [Gammaproteobacteria bacterium]MBU2007312.1 cupin-like domain-containing protein [Gammaproteobacteria bacterium]